MIARKQGGVRTICRYQRTLDIALAQCTIADSRVERAESLLTEAQADLRLSMLMNGIGG